MKASFTFIGLLLAAGVSQVLGALCFDYGSEQFCVYANEVGNFVKFRYDAPANVGYVAFGPGIAMVSGDIVVAWPNSDGTVTISRRLINGYVMPETDPSYKVTPVPAESGIMTVNGKERFIATFYREKAQIEALSGGADLNIKAGGIPIVWAQSNANPGSSDPAAPMQKHAAKGSVFEIVLLSPSNVYNPVSAPAVTTTTITTTMAATLAPTPSAGNDAPVPVSPPPTEATPVVCAAAICVGRNLQCGGKYYQGSTNCCSGLTCTAKSDVYSVCT